MRGSVSTYLYLAQGDFILITIISGWIDGYFFSFDIAMGFQIGPFFIKLRSLTTERAFLPSFS